MSDNDGAETMNKAFKDHFSESSGDYNKYRPEYPLELFTWLSSITHAHSLAWDCATGTGQSAIALSKHFAEVIATDASESQISHAGRCEKVTYKVATAENSGLESASVDLITVAQALHWFDLDAFASEVNRVLKPGGILSAWTYNLLSVSGNIDRLINHLYSSVLGDYWPKERALVEEGYKDIRFPFNEVSPPEFYMADEWDLSQLMGYLGTWSATKKYRKQTGINPLMDIYEDLLVEWGVPEIKRTIRWPLSVKVWQK